ncbi:hypothetical protein N7454_006040 [Penicillium verhagenii]|nr:hypothetical protein N7454_006040 [Penicillium verhagenii]
MDTVRESTLGQILRWMTGGRILHYAEENPGFVFHPNSMIDSSHGITPEGSHRGSPFPMTGPDELEKASLSSSSSTPTQAKYKSSLPQNAVGRYTVDWYGPDDPSNPKNWSSFKKRMVGLQLCCYTFVVYCGASIYVPAEEQIMSHFQVGPTQASLGLALYVLGYGVGPLLFSPMSEIPACGRNIPYISSFFIFVVLCVPTSLVDNFAGLMVLRFLQGFFGSPCLASGGASMADMYSDIHMPLALTIREGWRWALWEILWISGPVFCVMLIFFPETSADTILLRRAQRLRKVTGNPNIFSRSEISRGGQGVFSFMASSLVKPLEIMAKDPAILFTNIYTSLVYAIYYSFFESFPLVYPVVYGFSLGQSGLIFITLAVACGLGVVMYIIYLYTYLIPDLKAHGHRDQEHRLIPALVASIFPPVGLLIFGKKQAPATRFRNVLDGERKILTELHAAWTSRQSIHWIVSAIGVMIYASAVFIIFQCIFVYIPLAYPRYAASLFAGNDFSRSGLAFAFILFSRSMFINLGVGKGVTLLAGLSVLGIIGMLYLYLYGAKLRSRSKFAVADVR